MTAVSAPEPESEPPERKERAGVGDARAAGGGAIGTAARVLALQRTAGNRAVAAMIARDDGTVELAPKPEVLNSNHAIVAGVGTFPIMSWSIGSRSRDTGDAKAPPPVPEVSVTSESGDHSAKLMLATATGEPIPSVTIVMVRAGKAYLRLTITKAYLTSFSTGPSRGDLKPMDQWTVKGEKLNWEYSEPPKSDP
jgi:hypothetical protein